MDILNQFSEQNSSLESFEFPTNAVPSFGPSSGCASSEFDGPFESSAAIVRQMQKDYAFLNLRIDLAATLSVGGSIPGRKRSLPHSSSPTYKSQDGDQPQGGSLLDLFQGQRQKKRRTYGLSCAPCKASKKKCDGGMPCGACSSRGRKCFTIPPSRKLSRFLLTCRAKEEPQGESSSSVSPIESPNVGDACGQHELRQRQLPFSQNFDLSSSSSSSASDRMLSGILSSSEPLSPRALETARVLNSLAYSSLLLEIFDTSITSLYLLSDVFKTIHMADPVESKQFLVAAKLCIAARHLGFADAIAQVSVVTRGLAGQCIQNGDLSSFLGYTLYALSFGYDSVASAAHWGEIALSVGRMLAEDMSQAVHDVEMSLTLWLDAFGNICQIKESMSKFRKWTMKGFKAGSVREWIQHSRGVLLKARLSMTLFLSAVYEAQPKDVPNLRSAFDKLSGTEILEELTTVEQFLLCHEEEVPLRTSTFFLFYVRALKALALYCSGNERCVSECSVLLKWCGDIGKDFVICSPFYMTSSISIFIKLLKDTALLDGEAFQTVLGMLETIACKSREAMEHCNKLRLLKSKIQEGFDIVLLTTPTDSRDDQISERWVGEREERVVASC